MGSGGIVSSSLMASRSGIFVGVVAVLAGVFISLAAAGIIKVDEAGFNAPRWIVLATGMVFFLGGVTVLAIGGVQDRQADEIDAVRIFRGIAGSLIIVLFAVIANWTAFGPGDGANLRSRIAFGCGAVLLDLMVVIIVLRTVRNLLAKRLDE